MKNGDCLKTSQDPFCADANTSTGACQRCLKGTYFNSMIKKCIPLDPFCEKFNTDLF